MFSGWSDYQFLQYYSPGRLGKNILKCQGRVRAVGEVKSSNGNSRETKNAILAQAGMCTIRQFRQHLNRKIVLHEDISVHAAIIALEPTKATTNESYGEISMSYKLVDSVHGYILNNPNEL